MPVAIRHKPRCPWARYYPVCVATVAPSVHPGVPTRPLLRSVSEQGRITVCLGSYLCCVQGSPVVINFKTWSRSPRLRCLRDAMAFLIAYSRGADAGDSLPPAAAGSGPLDALDRPLLPWPKPREPRFLDCAQGPNSFPTLPRLSHLRYSFLLFFPAPSCSQRLGPQLCRWWLGTCHQPRCQRDWVQRRIEAVGNALACSPRRRDTAPRRRAHRANHHFNKDIRQGQGSRGGGPTAHRDHLRSLARITLPECRR